MPISRAEQLCSRLIESWFFGFVEHVGPQALTALRCFGLHVHDQGTRAMCTVMYRTEDL